MEIGGETGDLLGSILTFGWKPEKVVEMVCDKVHTFNYFLQHFLFQTLDSQTNSLERHVKREIIILSLFIQRSDNV